MDEQAFRWLVAAGAGLAFVALWVGMFQLFARIGGWRELARTYPPLGITGAGLGETFRMRSLGLRANLNYNACVTFVAGPATLRVSLPRLLAFGHPPFEVPWADIETEARRSFLVSLVTLRCARAPAAPIHLRRRLAASLARASGGRLRLPEATPGGSPSRLRPGA